MLERYLTITCDSDTVSVPGQVRLALRINKNALLSHVDDSVKNGVVHVLSSVISTQNDMLPDVMERDSAISLFYQAMLATNYCNVLRENYIDQRYERCKSPLREGLN